MKTLIYLLCISIFLTIIVWITPPEKGSVLIWFLFLCMLMATSVLLIAAMVVLYVMNKEEKELEILNNFSCSICKREFDVIYEECDKCGRDPY